MTIEEAYKILQETSPYIECANCEHFCESCLFDKAYDKAVKALEKQMPKKVKSYACAGRDYCPVCENEIIMWPNYCENCGQKFDWSK